MAVLPVENGEKFEKMQKIGIGGNGRFLHNLSEIGRFC
jgi:hypothetical protein